MSEPRWIKSKHGHFLAAVDADHRGDRTAIGLSARAFSPITKSWKNRLRSCVRPGIFRVLSANGGYVEIEKYKALEARNQALTEQVEAFKFQLDQLRRMISEAKSDRYIADVPEEQLSLFRYAFPCCKRSGFGFLKGFGGKDENGVGESTKTKVFLDKPKITDRPRKDSQFTLKANRLQLQPLKKNLLQRRPFLRIDNVQRFDSAQLFD